MVQFTKIKTRIIGLTLLGLVFLMLLPTSSASTQIFPNQGFESGSGTNAYGWAQYGDAERYDWNTNYEGSYVMRFQGKLSSGNYIERSVSFTHDKFEKLIYFTSGLTFVEFEFSTGNIVQIGCLNEQGTGTGWSKCTIETLLGNTGTVVEIRFGSWWSTGSRLDLVSLYIDNGSGGPWI